MNPLELSKLGFRQIPGFSDYYVDESGNVWSAKSSMRMNPRLSPFGYYRVGIRGELSGGKPREFHVHTLVLRTFVGEPPIGYQARHLNGNKTDNRLVNLSWGTPAENAHDRIIHKTQARGERAGGSKLTNEEREGIRFAIKRGLCSYGHAARVFGVNKETIHRMCNNGLDYAKGNA